MKYKAVAETFVSRFLMLILNFGLIIFSTNMWGSEGKGTISIVTLDLAIVVFFSNIFAGSSVSYFASKYKIEKLLGYAYIWSVLVGISVPLLVSLFHQQDYLLYLIPLSVFSSLLAANVNFFIGKQEVRLYNLYAILQLLVHIVFIFAIIFFLKIMTVESYFLAQIFCFVILFLISSVGLLKRCSIRNISFEKEVVTHLFNYGWKTQLSAFVQFLNNRVSFYFLEYYKGIASVGVFSVGVAFSEAIWTVSRSLALVLYSEALNDENKEGLILKTKLSVKISFITTALFIGVVLLLPAQFYTWIFGKDFSQTKLIILVLSPGILAIAVSNIVGFYFAGINKLKILNIKSFIGFIVTIITSVFLIPRLGILGVCIVTSLSYCVSSIILLWNFYQLTHFSINDFVFSRSEIKLILHKIKNKQKNGS
ncbi:lipopolysaccharide biosynthesis protein [Epilithonimonas zeae]|uniref:Membrane protein involved in the export of O-antigen and teichoic acid n=1 Tax=Epilithonimonas zeae TaxID=1416779 RepID=A0A1N6IB80_9FLAO|nr:polysaccharide biosynthesis C-terminal domain-containing protein [Epilithonimonas zeae]SIO29298.1 Membrane protein involved in the export of O-antigen and teichoic acid [Epilithonimonas zeae]